MATIYDCKNDARRASVWDTPQLGAEQVMVVKYDFTEMTGALGDYILGALPKDCIVTQVADFWEVAPVGTGDVLTLGIAASADAKLATDMGGYSAATSYEGVPKIEDPATWVLVTADSDIYFTIGTGVLTAGRLYSLIRYFTVPS